MQTKAGSGVNGSCIAEDGAQVVLTATVSAAKAGRMQGEGTMSAHRGLGV